MNKLAGCVALITGAGRGIGAAIALRYAQEGAKIVVVDLDETNARGVAEQARALGAAADAFVVDLMFSACGESFESLLPYAVTIDFEGVPLRTVNLEGLLKTKQSSREKDKMDRVILERALAASKH